MSQKVTKTVEYRTEKSLCLIGVYPDTIVTYCGPHFSSAKFEKFTIIINQKVNGNVGPSVKRAKQMLTKTKKRVGEDQRLSFISV